MKNRQIFTYIKRQIFLIRAVAKQPAHVANFSYFLFVSSKINSYISCKKAKRDGNTIKNKNPHFDSNTESMPPTLLITFALLEAPIISDFTT